MISLLSHLMNGLSLGSVYAIIALGYTMVYGIAKMLNFAHGDVIMIGAYISFCVVFYLGMPPVAAGLAAMAVCMVLGILIERLAYKPLRQAPSLITYTVGTLVTAPEASQDSWPVRPSICSSGNWAISSSQASSGEVSLVMPAFWQASSRA